MSPTPTPAASSPLKHIWLCIPPRKLGQVLGMSLPKGRGLAGPGGTTLPSALPPTHPSPLSDPETDPESSQSGTLQLPTRIAGGWWPPSCAFRHKLECRLHCSPWLERHTAQLSACLFPSKSVSASISHAVGLSVVPQASLVTVSSPLLSWMAPPRSTHLVPFQVWGYK